VPKTFSATVATAANVSAVGATAPGNAVNLNSYRQQSIGRTHMSEHKPALPGLHHVTAITADAQKNIDFYTGVLGLRLVKLTVNFDDPGSYHLYYGDNLGRPGTVLTFFAWPGAHRGRIGAPQAAATAFAVPAGSIDFWSKRLEKTDTKFTVPAPRFGDRLLQFSDPDGMALELIETQSPGGHPWTVAHIPMEHAVHGFHSVTLAEEGYEKTSALLTGLMHYKQTHSEQNRFRYRAAGEGFASMIDVVCTPGGQPGSLGAGIVHHIAFRTANDVDQATWRRAIAAAGYNVSPVMDRCYFHSIYYREPGGVLFEIATENPGFNADQTAEALGTKLMLPPWLEKHREQIEKAVPKVKLPKAG
jgi:glyoxalase family protein